MGGLSESTAPILDPPLKGSVILHNFALVKQSRWSNVQENSPLFTFSLYSHMKFVSVQLLAVSLEICGFFVTPMKM